MSLQWLFISDFRARSGVNLPLGISETFLPGSILYPLFKPGARDRLWPWMLYRFHCTPVLFKYRCYPPLTIFSSQSWMICEASGDSWKRSMEPMRSDSGWNCVV